MNTDHPHSCFEKLILHLNIVSSRCNYFVLPYSSVAANICDSYGKTAVSVIQGRISDSHFRSILPCSLGRFLIMYVHDNFCETDIDLKLLAIGS